MIQRQKEKLDLNVLSTVLGYGGGSIIGGTCSKRKAVTARKCHKLVRWAQSSSNIKVRLNNDIDNKVHLLFFLSCKSANAENINASINRRLQTNTYRNVYVINMSDQYKTLVNTN